MRIKAKTLSGREVYIVQFVMISSAVFAITVDEDGWITDIPAERLTVIDDSYRTGTNTTKTYVEYWNIGSFEEMGHVVDSINKCAKRDNAEIVGITYAGEDLVVAFKEVDNEQRAD